MLDVELFGNLSFHVCYSYNIELYIVIQFVHILFFSLLSCWSISDLSNLKFKELHLEIFI